MDGGETKRHNSEELKAENVNSFAVDSAKSKTLLFIRPLNGCWPWGVSNLSPPYIIYHVPPFS